MYLVGIVAGRMTQTGKIGYVAAWRHHSVVRPMNAFALGVRSVNPLAEIHVEWVNTWYNPDQEKAKADILLDKGVDIIAGHTDSPARIQAAKDRGKMGIGFHSDMLSLFPETVITSGVWDWEPYYKSRVQAVLDGTWASQNFWGGLKDGTVKVGSFGPGVMESVKQEVASKRSQIESGGLVIFRGELRNNQGAEWIAAGESLTDDQLRMMDSVFAEGIVVDPAAGMPPG
jgi:basic membrane lipoprotein Med (substrate-binding protein (PBP1-ABC) superfamily)